MDIYIVKDNETLNDILKRFNLNYEDIASVNSLDLNNLKEGDIINIPLTTNHDFTFYEIKKGDTLTDISKNNNIDIATLAYLNGIDVNSLIYPGQFLIVPKDNISIYITERGDSLKTLQNKFGNLEDIIKDNDDIYLVENQLIIKRNNTIQ